MGLLHEIIDQEADDFQRLSNRWRPRDLLMFQQIRLVLKDIQDRQALLTKAEPEFNGLDRKDIYITLVRRMRLWVRQALFTWKSDQLQFIQAIASFYKDYGRVLRYLKMDAQRGKIS